MEPVSADRREYWQRGPVDGVPGLLQPVAHTLLQVRQELQDLAPEIDPARLWEKPQGLASAGFHLAHIAGVLDRLFTYARGSVLSEDQLTDLAGESGRPSATLTTLLNRVDVGVDAALKQLKETDPATLLETCFIGRKKIPSTRIGLLFHSAEHLMRHVGQLLVTVRGCLKKQPPGKVLPV